ncbi:hypothetical protein Emag_001536 [Eimeria magna]
MTAKRLRHCGIRVSYRAEYRTDVSVVAFCLSDIQGLGSAIVHLAWIFASRLQNCRVHTMRDSSPKLWPSSGTLQPSHAAAAAASTIAAAAEAGAAAAAAALVAFAEHPVAS